MLDYAIGIDMVAIIERKTQKIGAAHGARRELAGLAELQKDRLPIHFADVKRLEATTNKGIPVATAAPPMDDSRRKGPVSRGPSHDWKR